MPPVSTRVGRAPRDALVAHLRDLASTHGDATVTLERGPFQARVRVRAGRVIEVRVDALDGERALLRALGATHGTWIVSRADGRPGTPLAPVDDLLAKLDARREHIRSMAESVGGLDRVWAVLFRMLRRELPHIPDDVNPLLRLVDGRRSIERILAESPFDEILTLRILHRLLAKGILIVPDLPDGVTPHDDAQTSAMAELFAQSSPPTSSVADDTHSAPPMSTTGPPRVEPRPLPTADDDGDGAPKADVGASAVTLKAWSSKREKPPGALPDDENEAFADEVTDEVAAHEDAPVIGVVPAVDSHAPDDIAVIVGSPSAELVDWLDEEHAFFTQDENPSAGSPDVTHAPPSSVPDRIVLLVVLFVVSILLAFAFVRLVTQGPSETPAPAFDVQERAPVENTSVPSLSP